eukprot:3378884-Pyramimonas_sp.AAC.1
MRAHGIMRGCAEVHFIMSTLLPGPAMWRGPRPFPDAQCCRRGMSCNSLKDVIRFSYHSRWIGVCMSSRGPPSRLAVLRRPARGWSRYRARSRPR